MPSRPIDFSPLDLPLSDVAWQIRIDRLAHSIARRRQMALAIRRQRRIWIAGMCAAAAVAMAIWAPLFLTATSGPLELEDATASTFSQWLQNGSCLPSIWSDPQNLAENCSN